MGNIYGRSEMLLVSLLVCFYLSGCSNLVTNKPIKLKYLSLSESLQQDKMQIVVVYENHLAEEFAPDDRVKLDKLELNKANRVAVLQEYLSFYGNETISSKSFSNIYGRNENRLLIAKENLKFPVEVEALYSMTTMLFNGSVIISPILINKETGEICNFSRKDLDLVFAIYREWFVKMKKNEFSKLTWPLEGTNYKWLGEDAVNNVETLLKQSL